MKFEIEITDAEDIKVLNACDAETRSAILHRGVKDYFYRKAYNKRNAEVYKEYTKVKRELAARGTSVQEMIKAASVKK